MAIKVLQIIKRTRHKAVRRPGISSQIKHIVQQCYKFTEQRANPKEHIIPWLQFWTDLEKWLPMSRDDRNWSLWTIFQSSLRLITWRLSAVKTICTLKSLFARHGITAEFAKFAKDCEIKHATNSTFYAQSSGEAERAVQTAKRDDPANPLIAHHSTPPQGRKSLPWLLFNNQIWCTFLVFQQHSNIF